MRLLVLGGTHHVGRAVAEMAVARGDEVTTVNRGETGADVPGVLVRRADRTDQAQLRSALGDDSWDAVIDTWSRAPRAVSESAALLSGRAGHYGYVSSRSVYTWPIPDGADESAPVVDGDAGSEQSDDYAAAKRGGELAVLEQFAGPSVLARAGLILGPYELVGRMPWWLRRIERGGDLLAPGSRANLIWVQPAVIEAAGIQPWTELPVWAPPHGEAAALHNGNVDAIIAAGLVCRPVEETVADTWRWLQAEGDPPVREGGLKHGLDPDREREVLASLA